MSTPVRCAWCGAARPLGELLIVNETGGRHRSWYVCRPSVEPTPGHAEGSCFRNGVGPHSTHAVALADERQAAAV